jgi:DNA helicase-2/ATP-dependent DNA helicase PcrA
MDPLLASLNPPQREAVSHGDGPLLVLAGAGSGKTRVLTHRIAYLVRSRGIAPQRILAVTFTNKAAQEMRERAEGLLGGRLPGLWIGTFHAMSLRILRTHAERVGLRPGLSVLDTDDQVTLMHQVLKEEGIGEGRQQAREILGYVSRAKNALQSPDDLRGGGPRLARVAQAWEAYQKALRRQNAVDFDDILLLVLELFRREPEIRDLYRRRFRHVLVDEYQDTNAAQFQWILALAGPEGNVFVVGDDDQSIYGWRGADLRNILEFERAFPRARLVRLEENYRSTPTILDVAHAVVSRNRGRKPKRLWTRRPPGEPVRFHLAADEEEEAQVVVEEIAATLRRGEIPPGEIAILYRTHAQSRPLEEACVQRRIPYVVVGGLTFFQRREVKDLLAYLRLAVNPRDEMSLRRAVSVPRRGVGEKSLAQWLEAARRAGQDPVEMAHRGEVPLRPGLVRALREWAAIVLELRRRAGEDPGPVVETLVEQLQYREYLRQLAERDLEDRLANVEELVSSARAFRRRHPEGTLEDYVGELSLLSQIDTAPVGPGAIQLMTVHNAKGLEFRHVYVTGLEEGLFPHVSAFQDEEEMEEERRLFYVACTRAKDRLWLTASRERRRTNRAMEGIVSRFIAEIPGELLETTQSAVAWSPEVWAGDDLDGPVITYDDPLVGRLVEHPTFGRGRVLHVDGEGDRARVTVRFPRAGAKKVLRSYLVLVEEES